MSFSSSDTPRSLAELIAGLPVRRVAGPADCRILSVVDDSRQARPGSLFVARGGRQDDGRKYAGMAVDKGAVAVLSDQPLEVPAGVAVLMSDRLEETAGLLADRFHDQPQQRLKLLAVTGTNGKTTTAFMIRHLINRGAGRCGLIGTVEIDTGGRRFPAELTTPGAIQLTGLLGEMVKSGCSHAVMETSSHALDQNRVAGLPFAAGIFTNLTGDHLDYHGTMDRYAAAKAKLFESLAPDATAVLNADDSWAGRMARDCRAQVRHFSLEPDRPGADAWSRVLEISSRATRCLLKGPWGEWEVSLPMIGHHNVANLLGAMLAVWAVEGARALTREGIASCPPVPGRLEPVTGPADPCPFAVVVDYAHTDDALENVLKALRPLTKGRLRVLFGCGGDRDPGKRPRMAQVACRLADRILVTSDNPRTENPQAILDDILKGVPAADRGRVNVESDRAAAIHQIVDEAAEGDVVLLAGKGHEDYQIIGTRKFPFDDRVVARQALDERGARA